MPITLDNIFTQALAVDNQDSHIVIKNQEVELRGRNFLSRFFRNHFRTEHNINTANTFKNLLTEQYGSDFADKMATSFLQSSKEGKGLKVRNVRQIIDEITTEKKTVDQIREVKHAAAREKRGAAIQESIVKLHTSLEKLELFSDEFHKALTDGLARLYEENKQENSLKGKRDVYRQAIEEIAKCGIDISDDFIMEHLVEILRNSLNELEFAVAKETCIQEGVNKICEETYCLHVSSPVLVPHAARRFEELYQSARQIDNQENSPQAKIEFCRQAHDAIALKIDGNREIERELMKILSEQIQSIESQMQPITAPDLDQDAAITAPIQVRDHVRLSEEERNTISEGLPVVFAKQLKLMAENEKPFEEIEANLREMLSDFIDEHTKALGQTYLFDICELLLLRLDEADIDKQLKSSLTFVIPIRMRNAIVAEAKESLVKPDAVQITNTEAIARNSQIIIQTIAAKISNKEFNDTDFDEIFTELVTVAGGLLIENKGGKNEVDALIAAIKREMSASPHVAHLKPLIDRRLDRLKPIFERTIATTQLDITVDTNPTDFVKKLSILNSLNASNAKIAFSAILNKHRDMLTGAHKAPADIAQFFADLTNAIKTSDLTHAGALGEFMVGFQARIRNTFVLLGAVEGATITKMEDGAVLPGSKVAIIRFPEDSMKQTDNTCFIMSTLRGLIEKPRGREHLSELIRKEDGANNYHVALTFREQRFHVTINAGALGKHKCTHADRPVVIEVFESAIAKFMESLGIDEYTYGKVSFAGDVATALGLTYYDEVTVRSGGETHTMESFSEAYAKIANSEDIITLHRKRNHWRALLSLDGTEVAIGNSGHTSIDRSQLKDIARDVIFNGSDVIVNSFRIPEAEKIEDA